MSRLRLALLASGVGAALTGGSVLACVAPGPEAAMPVLGLSAPALQLLESAAQVARSRSWTATQTVVSTRAGEPHLAVLTVRHTPGAGSSVTTVDDQRVVMAPDLLDDALFSLLVGNYDVSVVGRTVCAGRRAVLVEARRPGETGAGAVAGRFWIDRASGMVLRRDVLDDMGTVIRSSAYLSLRMRASDVPLSPAAFAVPAEPSGERLTVDGLGELASAGWPIVDRLPAGMQLFESRLLEQNGHDVVQLSYSDGLSTLSLFLQQGALPSGTKGPLRQIGPSSVHVTSANPEQLAWSGGGFTWTLVSDAPESAVEQAFMVLPHADPPAEHDGMTGRVWRGMSRVGGWLNPFD